MTKVPEEIRGKGPETYNYECEICGRKLAYKRIVWMDLNMETGEYRRKPWPDELSQGAFPIGPDCAKRIEKEAASFLVS